MSFTVDLPMPPSVNNLFTARTFKPKGGSGKATGRGLTEGYKRWRDGAGLILNAAYNRAGRPEIKAPWGWEIRLNLDRNSDASNYVKAIEDLLVKMKVTPGDNWMDDGRVVRDRTVQFARVTVFTLP